MFGHIDDIKPGTIFVDRKELAAKGVHAPLMSGIWGAQDGAVSIVLSGGYEDDIDELDYILYTGHGGQDSPGGKQTSDQDFTKGGNKGLQLSCDYSLPVRVTRGHQIENGPSEGYRYDGLYYVQKYERLIGKRGFYICRFHLVSEASIDVIEANAKDTLKPSYQRASRASVTVNRLKRNVKLSENIKEIYQFKCQVCNALLESPNGPIAIGAHIRPLGRPHDGPDTLDNMLCLCPNHHDQFDKLSFYVDPGSLEIVGLRGFEGQKISKSPKHKIGLSFIEYHKSLYEGLRR